MKLLNEKPLKRPVVISGLPNNLANNISFGNKFLNFIDSKVHHRSIISRIIRRKRLNNTLKSYISMNTQHNTLSSVQKAIGSFMKLYDGANFAQLQTRMQDYVNKCYNPVLVQPYFNAFIGTLMVNNVETDVLKEIYLNNHKEGRVIYKHSTDYFDLISRNNWFKRYDEYVEKYVKVDMDNNFTARTGYKPEQHGKQTDIGRASNPSWTYFLKIKNLYKVRNPALLRSMANDLRIHLIQNNITLDNHNTYVNFCNAVVNAFVPDNVEMYAQEVLRSKHILSGINEYNKMLTGDFTNQASAKERKLKFSETQL